jgi:hypothetical protein
VDVTFGTQNVGCLCRSGLLKTASGKLAKYSLDLMGAQDIRLDQGGTEPTLQQGTDVMEFPAPPKYIPGPLCVYAI